MINYRGSLPLVSWVFDCILEINFEHCCAISKMPYPKTLSHKVFNDFTIVCFVWELAVELLHKEFKKANHIFCPKSSNWKMIVNEFTASLRIFSSLYRYQLQNFVDTFVKAKITIQNDCTSRHVLFGIERTHPCKISQQVFNTAVECKASSDHLMDNIAVWEV